MSLVKRYNMRVNDSGVLVKVETENGEYIKADDVVSAIRGSVDDETIDDVIDNLGFIFGIDLSDARDD